MKQNASKFYLLLLSIILFVNANIFGQCGAAINIPSLPVTNQALVCTGAALPGALSATNVPATCGGASNSYKGGQEALYTLTPASTGSYTISYTGQSWSAIFVYSGACPTSGGTCVGSVGSSATSKSLIVTLNAGVLYYIWFDTWPTPNSPCPGTFSISGGGAACSYTVPFTGNNTITANTGNICDHAGTGNYSNNANGYTVINPVSGNVRLTFSAFNTETSFDYVTVFDGVGVGGTQLYNGSGTLMPPVINSTTGPLTIRFTSDGSVTAPGFTAAISNFTPVYNPCTSIGAIPSCGTNVTNAFAAGTGAYNPVSGTCGFATPGQEKIYTFTPTVTGIYRVQQTASPFYVDYFWKPASGGCNNTGWTCIQDLFGAATSASGPTLTAGVQYYIMADPETTTAGSVTFNMVCPPVPTVTSFTPTSGCGGVQSVVITGTNFTGATAVTFGGTAAQSFVVNNATQITAIPANAATGTVAVTTAFGTGTSVGTYTVNPSPAQPSLVTATPTSICEGSSANINATSVGNTINWYTVPSGGVAIGNTASGANLLVTPANTTTYYAESAAPGIAVTTFNYTGGVQTYTVPVGVTSITVDAYGAQGGNNALSAGGLGGYIKSTLTVTPGSVLNIYVGGAGIQGNSNGGYNGGGHSSNNTNTGSGGGASDIRVAPYAFANRIIVAGAGGGAGYNCASNAEMGGAGGGLIGGTGWQCNQQCCYVGFGGSQIAGGAYGVDQGQGCGGAGTLGLGGNGSCTYGGGGGAGYYGGGGGGYGGAGGGSSYSSGPIITNSQGVRVGNGQIVITSTGINGCPSTSRVPVTVTVNQNPTVTATNTPILCNGNTSDITATAVNGTPGYQYKLNAGSYQPSNIFTNNLVGIYTVTVSDANTCTGSTTLNIVEPTSITLTANATDALCNAANGSLTFNATGGTGIISYTVNGNTQTSPFSTVAGTYTIVATDVNGCTASSIQTINEPSTVVLTTSATNPLCYLPDVSLTFSATGGTGIINYTVNGNSEVSPYAAVAGTYTIVATDANGCSASDIQIITIPSLITLTASSTDALCNAANGSLTFNATGGTGLLSYTVNGLPQTSPFATLAGIYTIVATDVNGCTTSSIQTINEPTPVVITASATNALCNAANGSLTFSATGGTGLFTFTVNGNTQTSPFATVAGTYTIVATDINGCTTSSIQTINEPTPLVLTASATNALCNAANGSLTFSATGGTGLFTYTVNGNIQTSPFATGAGIYTIVATDINGCTTSSIQTINEPTPIALTASATNALCNAANGSLTFNATGGTGIISYTVNGNAQTSPFATVAGIYTIVATDINGCTTSSIQTINEPTPVVLTASATNALCNAANGSLTFSATGGTGLFTYTVNGVAQVSPYSTTAGSYTVIATDANNCSVSSVFIITEPNTIVIGNPVVINTGCYGISNGTFQMSATGGSLPYVYSIDPIVTQPASGLFDNVTNGTIYTITVTDANLCTATTTVQIGNPLPNVTASASANPICLGEPTILNGGGAVSYVWTGGVNDGVSFIPLATTTYTVTGTDGNTCIATSTITINVNPLPVITSISANPADLCDIGNADLLVSAAITPPTYCQPVTSCTFPDIITNVTFAGINRTSTCDAPGGGGYSIYALPNPTVVAGASYPISVTTGGDVEGAMAWIDYNQDGIFSPLEAIFNGFTGTNPATYTGTANIPLGAKNGNTRMRVRCRYAGNPNGLVDPPCSNITFGETEDYIINITGGTGGATYTWSPATFLNNVYIDNPTATAINTTTTYTVTVEDGAGCTATSSVTVNVNPLPNITATASVNPLCDGSSTICTGAGAGIGGSYVWSGGVVDGVAFTPIATTTYTVTGTTANGCTATSTITIVVNTNPIILASASPSSICEGFTSTLSAIGATSYIWNPGALAGSPTVSPLATTTYSVLATDGNGCTGTSEVTVSVNPLPTVTASPASQTICENAQATVNGGGAVSYVWTGGISNGVPFTVTGANVYTVTGTDGNGCENTATAEVLMNAAPVINATATPSTTCNLTSVNPCATGAVSYVWTGGLSNCTPFVATTTDTYTVTGTDGAGCTGTSSVIVTVNPASGTLATTTSNQAQDHGDDFNINYYAANCDLIATVDDGAGGNVLGLTTSTVNVDATASFHNGQPFVRRWYQITPTTNGSADVKLYINQTDFDDYNAAVVAPYLPLPTGPGDAAGIANIRITKNDDGGLGNNPIVITPAVSWNGTYWELSFNTPSFSQFRVHSVNPGNVPLPVTVTSFSGTKLESSDKLSWITSSEQNNAYFNLQHSTDGISFSTIAKVASKAPNGNSNTALSYTATNNKPALGHNYYRLQQVDIDNKVSVHAQIVDLIWGANGSTVSIYPNPTTDILNIDLYATAAQNTTVKLLDMSGRVIRQVQAKSAVGMNNIQLSLGEIASGVYTVQVYENNHLTHTSKVKKND